MSDAPVIVQELSAANGKIGMLTLHVPSTLNALTLEMVDILQRQLDIWRSDQDIAAVVIDGDGEKAFCAGGDVQALHASAVATPGGPCEYAETFFAREYRMNYTLHTYPKPVVCWGHGIVMGGGLGVLAGCSARVVTQKTRIAMPEITIALFPDVGGSWFLNRMPGQSGLFLALTGASINAADALFTGLADYFIDHDQKSAVLTQLQQQAFDGSHDSNRALVATVLRDHAANPRSLPDSQVAEHLSVINEVCAAGDTHQVIAAIAQLDSEDAWLAKARDNLVHGSPLAALWIARQLKETRHSSLREVFQQEVQLATNVVRHPEFAEGVRALLIDKDRQPAWQFECSNDVPAALLDTFFTAPFSISPLDDL